MWNSGNQESIGTRKSELNLELGNSGTEDERGAALVAAFVSVSLNSEEDYEREVRQAAIDQRRRSGMNLKLCNGEQSVLTGSFPCS
jgi:hypothetical protein